jgi:hypothetical protein
MKECIIDATSVAISCSDEIFKKLMKPQATHLVRNKFSDKVKSRIIFVFINYTLQV